MKKVYYLGMFIMWISLCRIIDNKYYPSRCVTDISFAAYQFQWDYAYYPNSKIWLKKMKTEECKKDWWDNLLECLKIRWYIAPETIKTCSWKDYYYEVAPSRYWKEAQNAVFGNINLNKYELSPGARKKDFEILEK